MKYNDKVNYWVELAAYDLDIGKIMLDAKKNLYVGFMCHQVIEKMLKAYFVSRKDEIPPYTHNLAYLAKKGGIYEDLLEEQKRFIDRIEPLNVEARYPTNKIRLLKSLDLITCAKILKDTEEMFKWIKKQL